MKESLYKKILLYGIVFLFIGAAIVPSISGNIGSLIQAAVPLRMILLDMIMMGQFMVQHGQQILQVEPLMR